MTAVNEAYDTPVVVPVPKHLCAVVPIYAGVMVAEKNPSLSLDQHQCVRLFSWASSGGVAPLSELGLNPSCSHIEAVQFDHGQSNPTYLVHVLHANDPHKRFKFVVRSKPRGTLLKGAHRIDREFRILSALSLSSVPVPQVYGYCEDSSVLGVPFYAMSYVQGRIFKDISLREVASAEERRAIYVEAMRVLHSLRQIDVAAYGLQSLSSSKTPWIDRQIATWYRQYQASRIPSVDYSKMEQLYWALARELEKSRGNLKETSRSVVHGDFRIDNLVFHDSRPECLAVLDWELVALGDPMADLASFLCPYHMPNESASVPVLRSVAFSIPRPPGIPEEDELIEIYLRNINTDRNQFLSRMRIFLSFAMFKYAAIIYGVQSRAVRGNAASVQAGDLGNNAKYFVEGGMNALKTQWKPGLMNIKTVPSAEDMIEQKVLCFFEHEIMPLEEDYFTHVRSQNRWSPWKPLESLKSKAKKAGLWNFFLPKDLGGRMTALEYAPLAEITGRCPYAAEVFNCSAPDTGPFVTRGLYDTVIFFLTAVNVFWSFRGFNDTQETWNYSLGMGPQSRKNNGYIRF